MVLVSKSPGTPILTNQLLYSFKDIESVLLKRHLRQLKVNGMLVFCAVSRGRKVERRGGKKKRKSETANEFNTDSFGRRNFFEASP